MPALRQEVRRSGAQPEVLQLYLQMGCSERQASRKAKRKEKAMRKLVVAQRLWLILFLFNMLVSAYSRHVGWMLFWAIAFSSYAYEYGRTEGRLKPATHAEPTLVN